MTQPSNEHEARLSSQGLLTVAAALLNLLADKRNSGQLVEIEAATDELLVAMGQLPDTRSQTR